MTTIKIQLDSDAMDHLFPPGSEARLELQNAVIVEMLKKVTAGKLQSKMSEEWRKQIDSQISNYIKGFGGYNPSLGDSAKRLIEEQVKIQISAYFDKLGMKNVNDFIDFRINEIFRTNTFNRIQAYMSEESLNHRIDTRITEKIRSFFSK